jgi:hypothetical protein
MGSLYGGSERVDLLQCIYGKPELVKEGAAHREAEYKQMRSEAQRFGAIEKAHKEEDLQIKKNKAQAQLERQFAEQARRVRTKERERKKWRTRILQRSVTEQKQLAVKQARAQKHEETNTIMMAYLKEYFVLTQGSLTPATIRAFLNSKDEIAAEAATEFVASLENFCTLSGVDRSGRGGKKFDYEGFHHFLLCQARASKPITSTTALELLLMQVGLDDTHLRKQMTDFNLKNAGEGAMPVAADTEQLIAQSTRRASVAAAIEREKEEASALAAEKAEELAQELKAEQLNETLETVQMEAADRETAKYTHALNTHIARQIKNRRILADKLIGIEETTRMHVEARHSRNEDNRYRQELLDKQTGAQREWIERERMRVKNEAEIEGRREVNMAKRRARLAKGMAESLAPCVRQVEDRVWIEKTETLEEHMLRKEHIRYAAKAGAVAAIMGAAVVREATTRVFSVIAETIERQVRETRMQQFKELRDRAMDPEVEKARQAIELQKMKKEEMQMHFILQRERANERRREKEAKEIAQQAAWQASLVGEGARRAILERIEIVVSWVAAAEDLVIIAKQEEAALLRSNELNEDEIRKQKAEAMAERQRQKKAAIAAKQDAIEAAKERHRIKLLQKERWKTWEVTRMQNEQRALKDVEGEAGIRADLELQHKLSQWKAWALENGKSDEYDKHEEEEEAPDLGSEHTSFARDVYMSSNYRHTVPLGPVAKLTPAGEAIRSKPRTPQRPGSATHPSPPLGSPVPRTRYVFPAEQRVKSEVEHAERAEKTKQEAIASCDSSAQLGKGENEDQPPNQCEER